MTILVTGASGNIGSRVCVELMSQGFAVRALSRSPSDTAMPDGVEVARGDLDRPESLAPALIGVKAMHLITHTGAGYAPLQSGKQIVDQAKAAGVERISILWRGVPGAVEDAAAKSGLIWTRLQPVDFMSNLLFLAPAIRAKETLREPHPDWLSAAVDESDVAAVAARVLVTDGHHGKIYSLTGPEALSLHDRIDKIGKALGRSIGVEELPTEEARARWRAAGFADEQIANLEHFAASEAAKTVTSDVENILGRKPRSFDDWLARNIKSFE